MSTSFSLLMSLNLESLLIILCKNVFLQRWVASIFLVYFKLCFELLFDNLYVDPLGKSSLQYVLFRLINLFVPLMPFGCVGFDLFFCIA